MTETLSAVPVPFRVFLLILVLETDLPGDLGYLLMEAISADYPKVRSHCRV
jgi:hypothetical protein